jgi:hypothetical protein
VGNTASGKVVRRLLGGAIPQDAVDGLEESLAAASTDGLRIANAQTTDYTLALGDLGKAVDVNAATAKAVTVPPNSAVAYPLGALIEVHQVGAGTVSLTPGVGVTITGDTVTPGEGGSLLLRKTGTNAWFSAISSVRSGTYGETQVPGVPMVAADADDLKAINPPVRAVSTTNLDLTGLDIVDGYQTRPGDYVLATGQTAAAENGLWVAAAGAWTRPTNWTAEKVNGGWAAVVKNGTQAGTIWQLMTTGVITIGTTEQRWVKVPVATALELQVYRFPNVVGGNITSYEIIGSPEFATPSAGVIAGDPGIGAANVILGGTRALPHRYGNQALQTFCGGYDNGMDDECITSVVFQSHNELHGGHNICGGNYNTMNGTAAGIFSGENNLLHSTWNVICGGHNNESGVVADRSRWDIFIGGGSFNICRALRSLICGGFTNLVDAAADYSAIVGGSNNAITSTYSFIGGGDNSDATGIYTFIGGGKNHLASGTYAAIIGGEQATASGNFSTAGGYKPIAAATGAVAIGYNPNVTSVASYGVAMGQETQVSAVYGVALGSWSKAYMPGQFSYAGGFVAARGDRQRSIVVSRVGTTNATPAELLAGGTAQHIMPANTLWSFSTKVLGKRTDVVGQVVEYRVEGRCSRAATVGSIALHGAVTTTVVYEDASATACDVTTDVDTSTGALRIRVTGEAAKTFAWLGETTLLEVA